MQGSVGVWDLEERSETVRVQERRNILPDLPLLDIMSTLAFHGFNKNYSSWSMRPWLVIEKFSIPATLSFYDLADPASKALGKSKSPAGVLPALTVTDGATGTTTTVNDSLAIIETLAELYPEKAIWPRDMMRRASARSVAAEMHSGFSNVRTAMTCNLSARYPPQHWSAEVLAEVERILLVWETCRSATVKASDSDDDGWLFGQFSAADAMYMPVVSRFLTYAVDIDSTRFPLAKEYQARVLRDASVRKLFDEGYHEGLLIPHYENIYPNGRKEALA